MSRLTLALLLLTIALAELKSPKRLGKHRIANKPQRYYDSDEDILSDIDKNKYYSHTTEDTYIECKDTICDPPIIGRNVSNIKQQKTLRSRDVKKLLLLLKTDIDSLDLDEKMRLKSDIAKITIDFFNYKKEAVVSVLRTIMKTKGHHSFRDLVESLEELVLKLHIDIVKHMDTIKKSLRVLKPPCHYIKYETGHKWTKVDYMVRPRFRHDQRMRTTKKFVMVGKDRNSSNKFFNYRGNVQVTQAPNIDLAKFILPL